ncbi:MAG: hypothetical protein R3324_13215, partial [Halobacteriales archaeon]|nr:hypothetical protein [Halobacteriales archaeon]
DFNVETRVQAFENSIEHELFAKEGGLQPSRIDKVQDLMIDVGIISEEEKVDRDAFVEDDFLPYS